MLSFHLCTFLLLLVLCFVGLGLGLGQTVFVSPQGSNTNNGLSPEYPVQTLQYAVDITGSGGHVIALPGNYSGPGNSDLNLTNISLSSQDGSEQTTINLCSAEDQPSGIFSISGSSVFFGFTVQGCYVSQVKVSSTQTAPSIKDIHFQLQFQLPLQLQLKHQCLKPLLLICKLTIRMHQFHQLILIFH